MAELPLTTYCPACGAYVLLVGSEDFECQLCGCTFDVLPAEVPATETVDDGLPF